LIRFKPVVPVTVQQMFRTLRHRPLDARAASTVECYHGWDSVRHQSCDHQWVERLQVTIVSGNVNGDRVADFEIEIAGIVNLRSGDFLL